MIKAVIFDLDGVIVSTDEYHFQSWAYMAKKENLRFNRKINNRLKGVSRIDSLNSLLDESKKNYTEEEKKALTNMKNEHYISLLSTLNESHVYPTVIETITKLKALGIKIAIGSSSKNAKFILKKIGLINVFDAIADGNDVKRSKPYPDIFNLAATKLGVNSKECFVIEDAEAGVRAAKQAGMLVLALGDAKNSSQADYRAKKVIEILELINMKNKEERNEV